MIRPIAGAQGEGADQWQRGTVANYNPDRGFGFFRYYRLTDNVLSSDTVFFHLSKSTLPSDHFFQEPHRIFEFRVVENPTNSNRSEAWEIRLLKEG